MADAAELRLTLNAIDNASRNIGKVTTSVSGLQKASAKAGDVLAGVGLNINAMVNPAMLAGQAIGKMAEVVGDSVGEWVDYNKKVREMTQVTGLGAEEISRIIQVADDWGISIDSVKTALAMKNKNGVSPSIANLADLADEYVNTATKQSLQRRQRRC